MTFSPAQIPTVQLWLDADTLPTADGATVTGTWADGSGKGNNATANGGLTMRTSGIGGHQAVELDGSTGFFQVADAVDLRFTTRMYLAAVIHIQSSFQALLSKGNSAADPDYLFFVELGAGTLDFYDGSSFKSSSTGIVSTGTDVIIEMFLDGTNLWYSVNGVFASQVFDPTAIQQSTDPLRIGRQGSLADNPFNGKLAELILAGNGTADASGETSFRWQAETRAYLSTKYGLGTPIDVRYIGAYNGCTAPPSYRVGGVISDGTTWVKPHGFGTLLATTGWESSYVKDPALVRVSSSWYQFYTGSDGSNSQIGRATGDGFLWTRDAGNPVLPRGGSGAWDEQHVNFPFVLYDTSDTDATRRWKMWYCGSSVAAPDTWQVGYAYSPDGVSWTRHASNPVLTPGLTYDLHGCVPPAVVKSGSTWHLFYGGVASTSNPGGFSLCHATASTAHGPWTKDAANPLLSPSTALQALTSGTSSGSAVYHVADTSGFRAGEPVFILEGTTYQLTKVASIDTSTQLTTTDAASTTWTTSATIRSAYWGSIVPRSIRDTGAGWVIYGTAFQQFSGTPFQERSVIFKAGTLGGTWSFDDTAGVFLPLGSWDSVSAENPSVVATTATTTTLPASSAANSFDGTGTLSLPAATVTLPASSAANAFNGTGTLSLPPATSTLPGVSVTNTFAATGTLSLPPVTVTLPSASALATFSGGGNLSVETGPVQLRGGLRARLVLDSARVMVIACLDRLGWFAPTVHDNPPGSRRHFPVRYVSRPAHWDVPVEPNSFAVSSEDHRDDDLGLGDEPEDTTRCYVDIYAQDDQLGLHLAFDVRDILAGKLPSIGRDVSRLDVYDLRQATPSPFTTVDIEAVRVDRAVPGTEPWQQHWFMVRFDLVDEYLDELTTETWLNQWAEDFAPAWARVQATT